MGRIPDATLQAAMQRLVDQGRAEWITRNNQKSLRLTKIGRAMIERRERKDSVQ